MEKIMKKFVNKRNVTLIILAVLFLATSFILYGKNKSKVFKDDYMKNIFVDEEDINNENKVTNINKEEIKSVKDKEESKISINNKMIVVEIKGEVVNPDVYELSEGSIIRDLINKAGGLTKDASIDKINRADKLKANQLVVIPNKESNENTSMATTSNISGSTSENGVININTANLDELKKINGVGEVKAKNIIEYREKNGGFKSIEEIKNIEGIGEKTFEKLKDKITN
ncbi:helix-hairpin-helix domain-containing protein [Clostridium sp. MB05]|jgi:competence protein ComEA